ncbi:MAG: hypothetical protein ACI865_002157 [Flavobacteriaceae bacterium]|jgi:hypothetical protein
MKVSSLVLVLILITLSSGCRKPGCKDITATNYDPEVKKDDGSCIFVADLTPLIIQNNLIGSWSGSGVASFAGGISWQATFNIESNGHYSGEVTSVQSGSITSVFDNGNDNLDNPEKKFTIVSIDAFGKAHGKVAFVHSSGSLMEYQIEDLVFSNNYEQLDFTVSWGAEMSYTLTRD